MKKRVIALALSIVMLATCLGAGMLAPTPVTLVDENGAAATSAVVPQLGRKTLTASYADATEKTGYQWQFSNDGDTWIDIYGETAQTCSLSYAKVKNMLDADGEAQLRCVVTDGEDERISSAATVTVDYSAQTAEAAAEAQPGVSLKAAPARAASYRLPAATQSEDPPTHTTYDIFVNYVFENGEIVADPYTASIAAGSSFSATVTFPTVQGYLPYVGETQQNSIDLNFTSIDKDYTYNVVYKPTNVNYTVIHYQQNLDDDKYTEVERETKQGLTNSIVPEVENTYDGFYALLYEKPNIAADGSTVVEIYYDRYYYLMNFDLDGGYGVEPIYARYGTPIGDVGTPTKAGYTFDGWDKTIPETMPAKNSTYTAKWGKCGDTAFTVAFYYENADDNGYTFMDSKVYQGTTGDRVSGSAYKDENFSGKDTKHFTYLDGKTDKNVEIKGDGSTVVKVYFSRNVYTMEFYGITCGKKENWWGHSHSQKCCKKVTDSFSAKYNANIAQQYAGITQNHRWSRWDADACTALVSYMPDNSNPNALKYWQKSDGDTVYNITYAYESENGTINHDEKKKFTALATSHVPMSYVGYSEDYLPAVRNGYSAYKDYSKAASPGFQKNGQINTQKVTLYYYANTYTLRFMNAETELHTANVKYNFSIKSNSSFTPDASYAPNGMVFDCWCLDSAGAQPVDWSTQKMPAGDLVLYAKWKPVTHTVEFYMDKDALDAGNKLSTHPDINVPHGSKATPTPAEPKNGSYTFIGWFYMENGVEKAFDFANMPVNKNMQVYGKWSSNVLKQYTIYYKIKGTDTKIAAPTTGSGLAGVTKTFDAKGVTDLYAGYQEGYFPATKSHSLTLDIKNDANNVYTFWYVQKEAVPYTVKYLNKETGDPVATEKTVPKNRKAVVTETFVPVSGMMPDAYQKRLVVSAEEGAVNEIIFYYTEDTTHAYYKITHYTENLAKDSQGKPTWTEYASSQAVGDIGTTYDADPMTIPGFTYDSDVEGTVESGELTANGLELKLYYTRNSYPYQVRYLEQGTGKQLADPKNSTGKYGQVISESAIDIANYTAVDPTSQTLNIRIEESSTEAKLNIITFYYTENEATINYVAVGPEGATDFGSVNPTSETVKVLSGTAKGSTAEAKTPTFRFVGWYSDADCTNQLSTDAKYVPAKINNLNVSATYYAKFEYNLTDLTITKTITGYESRLYGSQDFVFNVKSQNGSVDIDVVVNVPAGETTGSVTIKGLTVGETYTITENTGWSWRYNLQGAAAPTGATGTVVYETGSSSATYTPSGTNNEIVFTNNWVQAKWLSFTDRVKNIFGKPNT